MLKSQATQLAHEKQIAHLIDANSKLTKQVLFFCKLANAQQTSSCLSEAERAKPIDYSIFLLASILQRRCCLFIHSANEASTLDHATQL